MLKVTVSLVTLAIKLSEITWNINFIQLERNLSTSAGNLTLTQK